MQIVENVCEIERIWIENRYEEHLNGYFSRKTNRNSPLANVHSTHNHMKHQQNTWRICWISVNCIFARFLQIFHAIHLAILIICFIHKLFPQKCENICNIFDISVYKFYLRCVCHWEQRRNGRFHVLDGATMSDFVRGGKRWCCHIGR